MWSEVEVVCWRIVVAVGGRLQSATATAIRAAVQSIGEVGCKFGFFQK